MAPDVLTDAEQVAGGEKSPVACRPPVASNAACAGAQQIGERAPRRGVDAQRRSRSAAPRPRSPPARPCRRRHRRTRCRSSAAAAEVGAGRLDVDRVRGEIVGQHAQRAAAAPRRGRSRARAPRRDPASASSRPPGRRRSGSPAAPRPRRRRPPRRPAPASPARGRWCERAFSRAQAYNARFFATRHLNCEEMMESAADFGTGLRAHLGLEQAELELVASPKAGPGAGSDPARPTRAQLTGAGRARRPRGAGERAARAGARPRAPRGRPRRPSRRAARDRPGAVRRGARRRPLPDDDELARLRRRKSMA